MNVQDHKEQGQGAKSYQSFENQAMNYFKREHQEIRREPINDRCAWRGEYLVDDPSWRFNFTSSHLNEFQSAINGVRERGLELYQVHSEDFPLPSLKGDIESWRYEIAEGRGFVVLQSLPVREWGDEDSALAYWGLGLHLGLPGAQNAAEELLGHVFDTGEEKTKPNIRRYRTSGDIAYHCDPADIVGLLCLKTSKSGGTSRIVSSVSVYNELLNQRPDLIERLYEPFLLDGPDEDGDSEHTNPRVPVVPCRYAHGKLRTFYHSDYFRSVVRHPDVLPFSEEEQTLLDLYEEIATSPELRLDMQLQPGDIQLLSNHVILHARTAYEDDPGSDNERHLLRLWLSL